MDDAPSTRFWPSRDTPLILQTEASECGLACIAMISAFWGHRIDMASMRRRFPVSLKGATLKSLMVISQALGMSSRPLKLDIEHLPDLKLPCIIHWNMNHFVVLARLAGDEVVVHDPAIGKRRLSISDFSRHFTGVALELSPGAQFKPAQETQRFSIFSLMGRVVGLRRSVVQLLSLAFAVQLCTLILPFYIQWVTDEALVAADRDLLTVLGIGFISLIAIQSVLSAARAWVTTAFSTSLNFQWLGNVFAHLMKLPLPYFEKRHLGDIVSRFGSIQTIQHTLTSQFVEGVIDGLLALLTLVIMFLYSVPLALVACAAVLLYALLRLSMFGALREATSEQIIHAAKQQTHLLESARGVQSVRLFGRSEERRAGWMNLLVDQFNAELRIARLSISYHTTSTLLLNVERVIIIWMAALSVIDGKFSIGMILAFIAYQDQFSQRITSLIDKLFEFRMLGMHAERVADIVMSEPEEQAIAAAAATPESIPSMAIELRNVGFRYSDIEPLVLNGLSLTILEGQCIAVTGPSGCGKTTLVKLILGLIEPSEGEVLVGGVPLRRMGLQNYRRHVGTVMQDDHLFSGSIADNISFFDTSATQPDIEAAAELAAVHSEIAAMPMGYNTLVGDIGTGLSGGQKQRVLLARALYKQPRLLVLDEATSHLDVTNEQAVNEAILNLRLTRVIVAHRPETIAMAERTVTMAEGRIASDISRQPVPVTRV